MVINSPAFNLMRGLHRILALPVDVCSEGLLLLQSTHVFRNDFLLCPHKKAKLLFLFFPLGPWIAVIWYAQCQSETVPFMPSPLLPQPDPVEKGISEPRNSARH